MKNKHLSVWGIGPVYVSIILITTFILVIINKKLPFYLFPIPMLSIIIGIILIFIGISLWISAVVFSKITSEIKSNRLVTNGIFAYVRNPIYSAFMFICSGIIILLNNVILFVVPLLYWLFLTILMIKTEEKWLKNIYKQEYIEYCKKVNRCIPKLKNNMKEMS